MQIKLMIMRDCRVSHLHCGLVGSTHSVHDLLDDLLDAGFVDL